MEELTEHIKITEWLFDKQGGIHGTLFYIPKTKAFIQSDVENDLGKEMVAAKLKTYCQCNEVKEFVVVSEAWTSKQIQIQPSLDPNKVEVLIVCVISTKGNTVAIAEIYEENGKRKLKGWDYNLQVEMKTRWDDCLKY